MMRIPNTPMDRDEFKRLQAELGAETNAEMAELLGGISTPSVDGYRTGKTPVPRPVAKLMRLMAATKEIL